MKDADGPTIMTAAAASEDDHRSTSSPASTTAIATAVDATLSPANSATSQSTPQAHSPDPPSLRPHYHQQQQQQHQQQQFVTALAAHASALQSNVDYAAFAAANAVTRSLYSDASSNSIPFRRASENGQLIVERPQGALASVARTRSFALPHWQRHIFAGTSDLPAPSRSGSSELYNNPARLYTTPSPARNPARMSDSSTNQDAAHHALQRGASAESTTGYVCHNCGKAFARDDLLRRHLAREARAAAQPSLDRQKSCFECARSKARCDLEVPACGRCRARGKTCMYGARSGNPNVRKPWRGSSQDLYNASEGAAGQWTAAMGDEAWPSAGMTVPSNASGGSYALPKNEAGDVSEDYESDDSRRWSDSYQQYRADRTLSTSSSNTNGSYDYQDGQQPHSHDQSQVFALGNANAPPQAPYAMTPAPVRTTSIDTSVLRPRIEDDEATPVLRAVNAAAAVMGPPQMAGVTRARPGDALLSAAAAARPQVPRLLTGARMPRPPEAGQASARPLFSAQLDLSGWLEEPVIPSPLYRMGPSLSALGAASGAFTLPTPTSILAAHHANGQMLGNSSDSMLDARAASSDTIMGGGGGRSSNNTSTSVSQHAQVAARNWWSSGPPHERAGIDAQQVAQACAGHFTLYPSLMVLPDATSPVPPLFHRPWLAHTRLDTPASLAHVRIALAAHHVRLPASESMSWDMIRAQAQTIVASYDSLAQASDLEVHASTAALWFLIILLLMSCDPTTGKSVDESLTDASLVGLSHLSRLLLQRVQAHEHRQAAAQAAGTPSSFIEWGFVETMRRTLFACYALFVLQRFRETSHELQSRLAGAELVLDIKLPATASEFEAGTELEWRAAQHVKINDSGSNGSNTLGGNEALTMRELLQARTAMQQQRKQRQQQRRGGSGSGEPSTSGEDDGVEDDDDDNDDSPITDERKKQMLTYFDRHDDFTNVCLTVTFALDACI